MPDLLAIISKAVFDKQAPKAKLGQVLPLTSYRSASKHLSRLSEGGRLFLVTVRPPSEALWLVAVLESPTSDGTQWKAAKNTAPLIDITALREHLRFESGKGIQAAPGALGMSLQTPRALTPHDVERLLSAIAVARQPKGPCILNPHESAPPLPCLCKRCVSTAPASFDHAGVSYVRRSVQAHERILWYWMPAALLHNADEVDKAVLGRLTKRIAPRRAPAKSSPASSDEGDEGDEE